MPVPREFELPNLKYDIPIADPRKASSYLAENFRAINRAANNAPIFDEVVYEWDGGTWNTTSTSYVEFGGTSGGVGVCSGLFRKHHAYSKIHIHVIGTGRFDAVNHLLTFGARFVDELSGASFTYDVGFRFYNAAGDHRPFGKSRAVPKTSITSPDTTDFLPAGLYYVTLMAKIDASTYRTDSNDCVSMTVAEKPRYA